MGKYLKGILGPFSGLVGTVVGATWKGLWVMRSRPVASGKQPSEAQMIQRATFTMLSQFLSPINELLKVGYQAYSAEVSPFNAAFAANIDNAITGGYPNLSINYAQVLIAKGRLLAPTEYEIVIQEIGQVQILWKNNAAIDSSNGTDRLYVLAYNPAKQDYVLAKSVAARSAEQYPLAVPLEWSGSPVHVWIFFVSVNGKIASNSMHLGPMTLV